MKVYDLHTHSTYSDGTLEPAALLSRAGRRGIDVLALTDHDSVGGLAEAREAADAEGIRLVPGVEISVSWRSRLIHILGLGIDETNRVLLEGLEILRRRRDERAELMAGQLRRVGIPDPLAGARSFQTTNILSRTHFARYLIDIGAANSFDAAFARYLNPGAPGYVPMQWASLSDALAWIRGAGGEAVIAHPARYRINEVLWKSFLGDFIAYGGCGIEVVCSNLDAASIERFAQIARDRELLASLGSDFHTPSASRELGALAPMPEKVTPIWQAREW